VPKGAEVIYFYHGDDDLAVRRQVEAVKAAFAKKYGAENISQLNSENADAVLAELVNIGLFSMERLVVLNGVFANKTLSEKLVEVLPRVHEKTEVIITEPKPDRRTKLYKVLVGEYKSKEFALGRDVAGFTAGEAARLGVEISRAGIDELVNFVDGDRWRIASELKKLGEVGEPVSPELVRRYVEPELKASAFNLLDDLLAGQREAALAELGKLRIKEDANRFFSLLASQIFALSAVVAGSRRSAGDIAKDIGVHPFVIQKLASSAQRISKADVKKYSMIISETDEKIKTSKADAWTLIELAIAKF
jgi:DNA polymerase-3 subunit delta